ncbi:CRISPR-associated protein 1 [Phlyctochytrium planicorne]|nr:CRISPR-associated protein 1 [Phlyctochytrium planicorne]
MEYYEAEAAIETLQKLELEDIGTDRWFGQHKTLETLNIQAHLSAQNNTDPYITQALLTHNKVHVLVHNLLVTDLWKSKVFPKVVEETATAGVRGYFILHHEATLINLLEVILYNQEALMSLDEYLQPLVDYCARKFSYLDDWQWHDTTSEEVKKLMEASERETLLKNDEELKFKVAINAISIVRYISDGVSELPLSVLTLLLNVHDFVCRSVNLMEKSPWLRKVSGKKAGGDKLAYFEGNSWIECSLDEIDRLRKVEAQVWLIAYNLLMDNECRKKYTFNEHNHSIVLKLKLYLTEALVDQLPILIDLVRYLEELTIMDVSNSVSNRPLLVEIPTTFQAFDTTKIDFNAIIEKFKIVIKAASKNKSNDIQSFADMYNLNDLDTLLEDPKCSNCGNPAVQRCSRCKNEWYCGRSCQVTAWKGHKNICDLLQ